MAYTPDFQQRVNVGIAKGQHGDFASINPRVTLLGDNGKYPAGIGGVNAGSFVWIDDETNPDYPSLINQGENAPDGFVGRAWNGLITNWQAAYSMLIQQGLMVTAFSKGEFFIQLSTEASAVKRGDIVYADPKTGGIVDSTATGAVKTNYKYAEAGSPGEIVTISSWL